MIVDRFVAHFGSWWLAGIPPSQTASWTAYQLPDGTADLTNQFVVAGVNGGMLGLVLFVALISKCFGRVGLAMSRVRAEWPDDEKLLWGFGAALVATVVSFFSVSYFDQIGVAFYVLLASIASTTEDGMCSRAARTPAPGDRVRKSVHDETNRNARLKASAERGSAHHKKAKRNDPTVRYHSHLELPPVH